MITSTSVSRGRQRNPSDQEVKLSLWSRPSTFGLRAGVYGIENDRPTGNSQNAQLGAKSGYVMFANSPAIGTQIPKLRDRDILEAAAFPSCPRPDA